VNRLLAELQQRATLIALEAQLVPSLLDSLDAFRCKRNVATLHAHHNHGYNQPIVHSTTVACVFVCHTR
jgi:hypothetical protein